LAAQRNPRPFVNGCSAWPLPRIVALSCADSVPHLVLGFVLTSVESAPIGAGKRCRTMTRPPPQWWPTFLNHFRRKRIFMRVLKLAIVTAASACAVSLSACGAAAAPAPTPAAAPSVAPSAAQFGAPQAAASGEFGAGCAAVPTDASNPGSFAAMAKAPVATAASGNPLLSTLVAAAKQANLVDSLNTAQDITVFAPTNDAFGKIPKDDLDKVLADQATLTKILTYHVVPGRLTPTQLAGTHKTLEGGEVTVAGSGTNFTVNGNSTVVCGNVQTSNATVYIVDTVLMPKS
jgi:uncharacterized surface protein with fasciclin (FAS1) repeats